MYKLFKYSLTFIVVVAIIICSCYAWVNLRTRSYIYNDITKVPHRQVALVLGTSKYLRGKRKNEYYQNRIHAAITLYKAGKVDYFIVSGDNRKSNYNEPKNMQADLVKAGIPADHIQPDYAGFRTLDSVLRMEKVFGKKDYLIISQRFHNQRAIFLARSYGQKPIAYDAENPQTQSMNRVLSREVLARIKAILDIVINKQAKFYGDSIIFPPVKNRSQK